MSTNNFSIAENARESERLNKMLNDGIRAKLMSYPGVQSVSVGIKIKSNEIVWERCFHVEVDKKKHASKLENSSIIPATIEGIPTDIHEINSGEHTARAVGGLPISNGIGFTSLQFPGQIITNFGTIGAIGRIKGTCKCNVVALTNWHVLYIASKRIEVKSGTRIFQPNASTNVYIDDPTMGPDHNDNTNRLGEVIDGIYNSTVDCALIDVHRSCCNCCGVDYASIIEGLETISPLAFNGVKGRFQASAGDAVYFVGATSGPSKGYVVSEGGSIPTTFNASQISDTRLVPHDSNPAPNDERTVTFTGQLKIRSDGNHPRNGRITVDGNLVSRFVDHGDSGSLLVNDDNMAVGLIFATDGIPPSPQGMDPASIPPLPAGTPPITLYGYANKYDDVISALNAHGHDFEINYSQPPGHGSSGETISMMDDIESEVFLHWKEKLEDNNSNKAILEAAEKHRNEVIFLVNHCRPVTVAWHRSKGPAFVAKYYDMLRQDKHDFPLEIQGVTILQLLNRMNLVLIEHGSASLRADLQTFSDKILSAVQDKTSMTEILDALSIPLS